MGCVVMSEAPLILCLGGDTQSIGEVLVVYADRVS